ncbi:haloacid dehalogenase superfamily, subfamily IA, variant 3 with third motif having DD or ED [Streptosporangium subroseum]|uniref:Haloacid dehalogenase superfamily, subfamily IA, variant 3 with third motif having DD or ED n=1 Tax=Streptosporangium subroseum TaxID=106412 RepID=A0A239KE92_9ACTN|nr:HAD family phosphatase [Streptosporangium subroseum]SNT15949.1 haloacid dehalogenase superfamily, subfamily IA, variant 3 with third motif having DD or ED [Streptosporangium subroseum]
MSVELRAVLFDMDGTLVDTEGMWWDACAAVAAELGLELTDAETGHVLGRPVEHVAAHLLRRAPSSPSSSDTADTTDARLAEVGGWLIEAFAERIAEGVTPLPGAIRLLDDLRAADMPVALVSASPRQIVDTVLRTIGAERFALVVAAEDTVRAKPLPDPYLKAAANLGVAPAECVAVEDSPTGLAAAHSAGCRVLAVSGGMTVPDDVLIMDSLERVDLPLLRRLIEGRTSIG